MGPPGPARVHRRARAVLPAPGTPRLARGRDTTFTISSSGLAHTPDRWREGLRHELLESAGVGAVGPHHPPRSPLLPEGPPHGAPRVQSAPVGQPAARSGGLGPLPTAAAGPPDDLAGAGAARPEHRAGPARGDGQRARRPESGGRPR